MGSVIFNAFPPSQIPPRVQAQRSAKTSAYLFFQIPIILNKASDPSDTRRMSYAWTKFKHHAGAPHLTSDVAYMLADSPQDSFMSSEVSFATCRCTDPSFLGRWLTYLPQGCYEQTFPYQTQPNTGQWVASYSMSPNHAYTTSYPDSMTMSTALHPYSPSFWTPTSPTDSPTPSFSTPVDKTSSQTAVCTPKAPQILNSKKDN